MLWLHDMMIELLCFSTWISKLKSVPSIKWLWEFNFVATRWSCFVTVYPSRISSVAVLYNMCATYVCDMRYNLVCFILCIGRNNLQWNLSYKWSHRLIILLVLDRFWIVTGYNFTCWLLYNMCYNIETTVLFCSNIFFFNVWWQMF
jgi:hypothetical protein